RPTRLWPTYDKSLSSTGRTRQRMAYVPRPGKKLRLREVPVAWTTPATGDFGQVLTAAMYNSTVRDNLLETAPAIASAAGNFFVADGPNKLAERTIHQSYIGTQQGTTSGSWTHLATVGPQVTV